MTAIYNPAIDQTIDVPDFSVFHYRTAGWLLRSEWDEQRAEEAARKAQAEEDERARQVEDRVVESRAGKRASPPPLRAAEAADEEK